MAAPQSDNMPGNQSGVLPGNQPGDRPANQSGNMPGNQSGVLPGNQPGDRPANQSGVLPGNQSANRPGNQSGNRPGKQSGNQSGLLPGNRPGKLPGRCSFFVEKKNRFCKMIVGKGKTFCGEHSTVEEGSGSRRIVCPLDPKHTVSEDKLEKHLKKCNSREKPKPVYFVENINAGSADGDATLQQVCLSERSRTQLQSLVDKLKSAMTGLQCDVEDSILSHPALQQELNNPKNGDSALKHLKQQSSLLGHMEALGLLGRGRSFVEFGAGRGKLSHWIHEALKTCEQPKTCDDLQLLLVERCSTRFKVDGKHQDPGVEFVRLQVDIQHLDLSRVPQLRQKKLPLVGVGKHLCGAATDLALRCLLETPEPRETEPPPKRLRPSEPAAGDRPSPDPNPGPGPVQGPGPGPVQGPGPGRVQGLAVALCCHHRCDWQHYVGQQFFLQRGLGAEEFSAFCRMSSWATCGLRPTNPDPRSEDPTEEEHEPAEETDAVNGFLSADERQRLGRLCKRLIDCGRIHFLQRHGFTGSLTRYITSDITLENVLLTAVPSSVPSSVPTSVPSL
ncbi:tRNA:m(4)X modification enzyme TRM13 homolog [Scomber japonicus]|uniref:tRNA:m(4)X modification enzyme TRM13 homolog n=1 Tax=Scomber japonicus TaxID=13676 RepID=UPI0023058706|nr:tRNA:m(4)X modification enzyme TRM13 homolog [Scomber japonicus]